MTTAPRDSRLYNCCPGHRAPDWSRFVSLETHISFVDGEVSFWSVYARAYTGNFIKVSGCYSRPAVDGLAAELSAISGLPIRERAMV